MPEIPTNTSIPDMSDVLSTYKSHPTAEDEAARKGLTMENRSEGAWSIPKCETPFEKKMYIMHEGMKMFALILNSVIRLAKVGAWCIAIFGSLFVALLATNKIDQATEILNKNILSKWGKTIDVSTGTNTQAGENQAGLKSSTIDTATKAATTAETPEMIAKKRAALLEARKVARLQQEKLKAAEQDLSK